MSKEVLYLVRNQDGTELASNYKPFRVYDKMIKESTEEYRKTHPIERYCFPDQWMNIIEDTDYGYYGEDYSFEGVTLPKGTIKKLTGKEITWDDDPIEIEFEV